MGVQHTHEKDLFWNYYISLKNDLEIIEKYIEFDQPNYKTYSTQLAKLLLESASEVDVVMKQLCNLLDKGKSYDNIVAYRSTIKKHLGDSFLNERVCIPRHGIELDPWEAWREKGAKNPMWWKSYNNVKHRRDQHFNEANLQNVLNAQAALFLTIIYYRGISQAEGITMDEYHIRNAVMDTMRDLNPEDYFLRLKGF